MRGEIKKKRQKKKKPKCGETERDTGCSVEALVAQLPRMLSDSGWLMTGSHGHSESERAGAALRTRAPPLIRPVHTAHMDLPHPAAMAGGCCCLPSHPSIHSFIGPRCLLLCSQPSLCLISLIHMKTTWRIFQTCTITLLSHGRTLQGVMSFQHRRRRLRGTCHSAGCQNESSVLF